MGSPPFYVQGIHRHARRPPLVRMQASKSGANLADALRRVKDSTNLIRSGIRVDAGAPFFYLVCVCRRRLLVRQRAGEPGPVKGPIKGGQSSYGIKNRCSQPSLSKLNTRRSWMRSSRLRSSISIRLAVNSTPVASSGGSISSAL
ncbi:MAG: hypothetical protein ACI82A_002360 [Candidatus Azotimanducaceae bacterium]|jgi:hypothetical protein